MRLIKSQNTNLRSIQGPGIKYDINGQAVIDSSNSLLVPKGSYDERPDVPANGHIRYNTDSNLFEFYENSSWRTMQSQASDTSIAMIIALS